MKRLIPVVILVLVVPTGLSAPAVAASPSVDPARPIVAAKVLTDDTLYVNAATINDTGTCLSNTTSGTDAACKTITAALARAGDDSVIVVAAGEYTSSLNIGKRLTIIGAGNTDDSRVSTVIKASHGQPAITYSVGGVSGKPQLLRNVYVTGGSVGGNNGSGISIKTGVASANSNFEIDEVTVHGNKGSGIVTETFVKDVVISESTITNNDTTGVRVSSSGIEGLTIENSRILNNLPAAAQVSDANNPTLIKDIRLSGLIIGGGDRGTESDVFISNASGTVTVENVNFTGTSNGMSALVLMGTEATVALKDLKVGGVYRNGALKLEKFNFAEDDSLVMSNVTLDDTITNASRAHLQLAGVKGQINVGNTSFGSNTPALDISLSQYSGEDATVSVDATLATFRGKTGKDMWPEERFAQQARIVDRLTNSTGAKGLVRFVDKHIFALAPATTRGVQRAVNAASPGDTIEVRAGTYDETISITKPIALLGPFADTSPWSFDDSTSNMWGDDTTLRATIRGVGGQDQHVVNLTTAAAGTRVAGLEITRTPSASGAASGIRLSGAGKMTGLTIENNYIHDTNGAGIYLARNVGSPGDDTTVIRGNLLSETSRDSGQTGIYLWYQNNPQTSSNLVKGYDRGIGFDTVDSGATIASNLILDIAKRGIQLAGAVGGMSAIRGNSLINTNYLAGRPGADSPVWDHSASIALHEGLRLNGTLGITNNLIQQLSDDSVGTAIAIRPPANGGSLTDDTVSFSSISISLNRFAIPEAAARVFVFTSSKQTDDTLLLAETNDWGVPLSNAAIPNYLDDTGIWIDDTAASRGFVVDYDPWIASYTNDPSRAGQPGFWPIPTLARQTPTGSNVAQPFPDLPGGNELVLTFSSVTVPGTTTVKSYDPATPGSFPQAPSGFSLGSSPVYYTIQTQAQFSGLIELCFTYDPAGFGGSDPKVYHFTGGQWFERSTTIKAGNPPKACASVSSFSQFALGVPLPPPPPPAPTFPPSAPRELAGAAGDARITATWAAPADSGSFPVTSYQVEALPGAASCLVTAPALTCTITGLTNGTAYTLRARALNGAGWSAWSEPSAPATPGAGTPSAPTNVVAVAGNAEAVITWTAPAQAGDSAITGYRIEQSRAGGEWTAAVANTGSTETIATVAGLVNGDSYRFRIAAINASGTGPVSPPSPAVTPEDPEGVTILITGERTTVKGKSGIRVTGETTGLAVGAVLRPWLRFPGQSAFARGGARILVGVDGAFTWQRKTGKKVTVYVQAGDGTRSNRVVIPAR